MKPQWSIVIGTMSEDYAFCKQVNKKLGEQLLIPNTSNVSTKTIFGPSFEKLYLNMASHKFTGEKPTNLAGFTIHNWLLFTPFRKKYRSRSV
jgi:hypothetical protein